MLNNYKNNKNHHWLLGSVVHVENEIHWKLSSWRKNNTLKYNPKIEIIFENTTTLVPLLNMWLTCFDHEDADFQFLYVLPKAHVTILTEQFSAQSVEFTRFW